MRASFKGVNMPALFMGAMLLLQAGLMITLVYFGRDIRSHTRAVLEQTSTMRNETLPAIGADVSGISRNTAEIKVDMNGIRNRVISIDERVYDVRRGVNAIEQDVQGLNQSAERFFQDHSGMLWGIALNPYIFLCLPALLAGIVIGLALYVYKNRSTGAPHSPIETAPVTPLSKRLDELTAIMGRLRPEELNRISDADLRRIMRETERLIHDTRLELGLLSNKFEDSASAEDEPPALLH